MHLKISSSLLSEAIKIVEKAVNPKHSIPILQGIYVEATEQELIFIGSDSNESEKYILPVDGQSVDVIVPGKTVISKQITETIKRFKKDIEMRLDGYTLFLKSGRSEFDLNTFDPEEYPKLPKFDIDQPTLTIKGTDFIDYIKKTAYAASESEIRPLLQGVCLHLSNGSMSFVSTDSHRLGRVQATAEHDKELKLVIPAKSVDKLTKLMDVKSDVFVYCESDNQVIFRSGALIFYCRLLEGTYPETSRLIPTDFKAQMKINRKDFLDELEIVRGIADKADNGKGGVMKLHVNGAATLSSHTAQAGKGKGVVDYASLEGDDDFSISFSAKYMSDALKALDDEFVYFKYQGNMRPFVLTPSESKLDEIQLILPVRDMSN